MADKLMNLAECERVTGLSRGKLERRIRDGGLKAQKIDGQILVNSRDVGPLMFDANDGGPTFGETCRVAMIRAMADSGNEAMASVLESMSPNLVPVSRAWDQGVRRVDWVSRDMNAVDAASGGYLLGMDVASEWWDRARSSAPLNWIPVENWRYTKDREYDWTTVQETTRANGQAWGGVQVRFRAEEGSDLSATTLNQPQVSVVKFEPARLVAYGPRVSNDLINDALSLGKAVLEPTAKGIGFMLVNQLIGGLGYGKASIINSSGTVSVTRATGGTIKLADVDSLWSRLYGPCRRNTVWLTNDDTLLSIDQLATTELWPTAVYMPMGTYQNPWPLLKGRPLLAIEQCPKLGQPGDLICADMTQVGVVSIGAGPVPPLALGALSDEAAYRAIRMEFRISDQRHWDTDQSVFFTKARLDIMPLWNSPLTAANTSAAANTLSAFTILTT